MLQNNKQGFTIVETLIVLAIVGAIMLVVFLAVPALQRNSRNTSIKNDASNVLAAVSEYIQANNGKLPNEDDISQSDVSVTIGDSGSSSDVETGVDVNGSVTVRGGHVFPSEFGEIRVAIGYKCNGNSAVTATPRAVAVLFKIETSGANGATQCIDG